MARRRGTYRTTGSSSTKGKAATEVTLNDMLSYLSTSLIKQANEPNLYAYKPHEKQDIFHTSEAKGRLYIGGNRSGKTYAGVVEDLWWVTRRHPYRKIPSETVIRGRVLGDGFDDGTINDVLIPTFKRWVIPSDLINGSWEDSWTEREKTLTFENGSFIEFKSYGQDIQKHAGTSRHFLHFDEEPPQNIYIENLLRIVDTQGSWWMTMTPLNGMNWVYDELYQPGLEGKLRDVDVIEVSMLDNPYIQQDSIDVLLQNISKEDREQRVSGKFAEKGGLIFPEFGQMHLLEGPEWDSWKPPSDWRVFMSLDHGYNNPTAILWHAVSPDNEVITFGEIYERRKIIEDHAAAIKKYEAKNNLNVFLRPADPAIKQTSGITGTSVLESYSEHGIYLSVENIPRKVAIGIDKMHTYMRMGSQGKPHWQIIASRCPNLCKEMPRLRWKTYSSSKLNDSQNRQEEVHKKNDHAFDSSRYFFTIMPDLSPEKQWHMDEAIGHKKMPKSYVDTLVDMFVMSHEGVFTGDGPQIQFAETEYTFANLEG